MANISSNPERATPQRGDGQLAENILMFCRTLRRAGLPVGTAQVVDALAAATKAGLQSREDFYWALRSVLVNEPSQFRLFQQAFHLYFRNPRLLERAMALVLPESVSAGGEAGGDAAIRRLLEALSRTGQEQVEDSAVEVDRSETWSHREILRKKDFEQMTLSEQREARELLQKEIHLLKPIATRRFRPDAYGQRYDLRRSLQAMTRNNGQVIELTKKRRQERPPVLVLICDISGSMSRYSRMFLHFAHALSSSNRTAHSFVFGTRLTNISHRLRDRDIDRALAQISIDVRDWDGGTRIGECLERFNKDWSRRVLAQNAVVILLSDGLERDSTSRLEFQMQRLQRSCRQLIWLNPVLRYAGFEPKAGGIRAMLPHVDLFLPAHNIDSLARLGRLVGQGFAGGAAMNRAAGFAPS
ncbi:MAG: VWA domain-containing protein [Woeseia sp.]